MDELVKFIEALDNLEEFLKSKIKDKEITITKLKMGDISSIVAVEFADALVEKGVIDKENHFALLMLLADFYTELSDAIFKEDSENE